jgi:putative hydrolase of HD superfamily
MVEERLARQIEFIIEIDKLKTVYRRSYLASDNSRRENSAEHSWYVTTTAMFLAEYCKGEINLPHVLKMLLIHDIVEVDAGDTGAYDSVGALDKEEREKRAAERIFSLLPASQAREVRELWVEFEERITPEAKFARAVDRLMPLLLNYYTQGKTWHKDGITYEQVLEVNQIIRDGSPELWRFVLSMIEDCVKQGYLPLSGEDTEDDG